MIEQGQVLPDFVLEDLDGNPVSLVKAKGQILALVFWSAECPWSQRADALIESWRAEWDQRVLVWRVASNKNEEMGEIRQAATERQVPFILLDPEQRMADHFGAVTTPHCFLFDETGRLRYRGALDDITFRQREATQFYLKDAVEALLAGKRVDPTDTPSFGCTIVRLPPAES